MKCSTAFVRQMAVVSYVRHHDIAELRISDFLIGTDFVPRERKNAETTELILQYNFIENTDSWKGRVKGGWDYISFSSISGGATPM